MFNNETATSHIREFLSNLDKASDPNADFKCFGSSDLSRLGVGHMLMFILWEKNWAPDALIEGFDEDPRTATGASAVAPSNASYFQIFNEGGKRILEVMYDRPVGSLEGIPEPRATYIVEFNKDLNKWQIVHAKVGL